MKNSTTTSRFPLPNSKIWTRLPERVKALEEKPEFELPYKVYTALLTQSGGNSILELTGGNLTIGVTYEIYEDSPVAEGFDFTNVGAPNNDIGTLFVATGTVPNSWGNNNVGLKYNSGSPVAIVLENTIGDIWFEFNNDGFYYVKSNDLFVSDKTFVLIGTRDTNAANSSGNNYMFVSDSTTIIIDTQDLSGTLMNSNLYNTPIEIRVYN